MSKKRDVVMDTKTKKVYQVESFSDDYNSIQLAIDESLRYQGKKHLKCFRVLFLTFQTDKKYMSVHYNTIHLIQ